MQIKIEIPFRKTLIIIAFIALLVMAGFSIAMMIVDVPDSSLLLVKNIVDIVLWTMFAVWFFVLILYKSSLIGHKGLNIVTSLATLVVFTKALLSIALVFTVNPSLWTTIFSVMELLIWIGLIVCMINVWFQSSDKA